MNVSITRNTNIKTITVIIIITINIYKYILNIHKYESVPTLFHTQNVE